MHLSSSLPVRSNLYLGEHYYRRRGHVFATPHSNPLPRLVGRLLPPGSTAPAAAIGRCAGLVTVAGTRYRDRRHDYARYGELRGPRHRQRRKRRRQCDRAADRHTGRAQHRDGRYRRRHHRERGPGDRMGWTFQRPCRIRRRLHHLCNPCRRDGAEHQHRVRIADPARRRWRRGRSIDIRTQGDERRDLPDRKSRPHARPQRRLGGGRRPRRGQHHGRPGAGDRRHRCHGARYRHAP